MFTYFATTNWSVTPPVSIHTPDGATVYRPRYFLGIMGMKFYGNSVSNEMVTQTLS